MTRCNTQANDMATTTNNWRTPGTSVSGRYTTPLTTFSSAHHRPMMVSASSGVSVILAPRPPRHTSSHHDPSHASSLATLLTPKVTGAMTLSLIVCTPRGMCTLSRWCSLFFRFLRLRPLRRRPPRPLHGAMRGGSPRWPPRHGALCRHHQAS